MKKVIDAFKQNVKSNIDGFIAMSITEIKSGISYTSESVNDFDTESVSSFNLEVVNAKLNAIDALGLKKGINDITITLNNQFHILNVAPRKDYFVYLAVDSEKGNLGVAKSLLNKYKQELYNTLWIIKGAVISTFFYTILL